MTDPQRLIDAGVELTEKRRRWVYLEYRHPVKHRRVRERHDIGKLSLIEILELDVHRDDDTSPKQAGAGRARGFASRPPGHYAPRELLHAFTHELSVWLASCGLDEREGPTHHVRALIGVANTLAADYPGLFTDVSRSLEHWGDELRGYAGLDHLFRPRSTCPQCDVLGRLTIWIDEDSRRAQRARCSACRAKWDATTVGVLVEHIRTGSQPTVPEPRTAAPPPVLCPRCGGEPAAVSTLAWHCVPCELDLTVADDGILWPVSTGAGVNVNSVSPLLLDSPRAQSVIGSRDVSATAVSQ